MSNINIIFGRINQIFYISYNKLNFVAFNENVFETKKRKVNSQEQQNKRKHIYNHFQMKKQKQKRKKTPTALLEIFNKNQRMI